MARLLLAAAIILYASIAWASYVGPPYNGFGEYSVGRPNGALSSNNTPGFRMMFEDGAVAVTEAAEDIIYEN